MNYLSSNAYYQKLFGCKVYRTDENGTIVFRR